MITSEYQTVAASSGGVSPTALPPQEVLLNGLDASYQFRNHDAIQDYLSRHDYVVNVLLEAPERVKSHFGCDTQMALEVITDPEDGDVKLFAFVLTPRPVEEALDLRDQLDEEWWLDASERAQGQVILDVEVI